MENFDIAIVGGGPSGYAAAIRALDFGKKTALIEKNVLGGAGLFNGALSSKTFWEISRDHYRVNEILVKNHLPPLKASFREISNEVDSSVGYRTGQLKDQLNGLKKAGKPISFFKGNGKLINKHEINIIGEKIETIRGENIILATGSRPRKLPEIPIDEKIILSSDGIGNLDHFPSSIVILGAGVIGCEFATIFANFGATRVYIIDKADRILPNEDEDLSNAIEQNLEAKGVTIHKGATFEKMEIVDGKVNYELTFKDGSKRIFNVEKALISIGRVPNVEGLGFKEAGVTLDERNHVFNSNTQTSVPNIYAVGDLTADIALVNVGELEGRHAVEKIYGNPPPLCHDNISTIMFLSPETAGVGMNEQQARKAGIPYIASSINFGIIPRAIAMRQTQGFFKILVSPGTHKILGMRAVGEHASSAIQAVSLLIASGKSADSLAELIHPHPSIIEGIQECVRMLNGNSIFKPGIMPSFMSLNEWNPAPK